MIHASLHSVVQTDLLVLHLLDAAFVGDLAPLLVILHRHYLVTLILKLLKEVHFDLFVVR